MPSDERGAIRSPQRATQLIDYRDLRWGRITPTNVDGLIDFAASRLFIMLEFKLAGAPFPLGQRLALANTHHAISNGGADCVVLVAEHNATDPAEPIRAGDADVVEILDGPQWRKPKCPVKVRTAIDYYRGVVSKRRRAA